MIITIIILLLWAFFGSSNMIFLLICLFLLTILNSFMFYLFQSMNFSLYMMLIVMMTGLFLVFTYICSLEPELPHKFKIKNMLKVFFFFMITCYIYMENFFICQEVYVHQGFGSMDLSLFLVLILLSMVVYFIRLTYSKGGSLRKKF